MTRQEKIEFLKGLSTGTRTVGELVGKEEDLDYSKFTTEELKWIIDMEKKHGKDPLLWPLDDRKYLLGLIRDFPNRKSWNYNEP